VIAENLLGLSNEEWGTIYRTISEAWPNKLSYAPSFSSHEQQLAKCAMTDVIEL
jgi:hypothetical protein